MTIAYSTKIGLVCLAALAVIQVSAALAADDTRVYRWEDADGTRHYGDYVPPEYAEQAHTVLNEQGIEIETVGARGKHQTAEERRQAELAAERARELEAAAIRDKVLLSTYLSVDEIEALRDRRVELLAGQIRITQVYLDNLREKLLKLEREAQRFSPYSTNPDARPIDEKLARELSDTLNSINLYEKNMANSMREQREVKAKFAADIKRFSELKGLTSNR